MMKSLKVLCVLVGMAAWHGAQAQAPAGTPAGANGMCNDGTFSMQASKDGACRGHKGVKAWYAAPVAKPGAAAPAAKTAPAPMAAPAAAPAAKAAPAPMPAPAAAPAPAAKAAPAPMPAAAPASSAAAPAARATSSKTPATAKVAAAGGGPGLVWVNTRSKVYHCYGTQDYGTTKEGSYMSESDAKAKGARADAGKACK